MKLEDLLQLARIDYRTDAPANLDVEGVHDDSRQVCAGMLFVARPGTSADGAKFALDAIARGAVAVMAEKPIPALPVPQIIVHHAGDACSRLAHVFAGNPSHSMKVLAVTGTNGKTTTAYLVRHILAKMGIRSGLVGTVDIDDGRSVVESDMTTPPALELANLMSRMVANGCAACAIETSSHALDQGRIAGVRFAAAGFTNLTGDHLDYHKTLDAYGDAKARLFDSLDALSVAVVNADDPAHRRMIRDCRSPVVRYAIEGGTADADEIDFMARRVEIDASGTRFLLESTGRSIPVSMRLVGRHNIQNALTASLMVTRAFDVDIAEATEHLADAVGAPGRLQPVSNPRRPGVSVLVDYAHTDDALENVLRALRPLTRGKLRVVFGCGGDRDRSKRPRMAMVAQRLGDAIYVTSDNPRSETPENIINEIISGLPADAHQRLVIEPDRRQAIHRAIADAETDDVVLIAGKGHEKYQIVGSTRHHFDDVEEALNA
jgi:UDP-N-acetylmuramoyl-L-alanyl-D-glutamate--2,6-diaminopimelate ligase